MDINQERIKKRASTKRGSKIISVRVSLLAAEMNPETDFLIDKNLIDISWQPCDVRVIVALIVPDNTLLRRLRVLHPKQIWISALLIRILCCLANARQKITKHFGRTVEFYFSQKLKCIN